MCKSLNSPPNRLLQKLKVFIEGIDLEVVIFIDATNKDLDEMAQALSAQVKIFRVSKYIVNGISEYHSPDQNEPALETDAPQESGVNITEFEVIDKLGGGEVITVKGRFKIYELKDQERIHLKRSKYHTKENYYWYGITQKAWDYILQYNVTHLGLVMGDEGFVIVPKEIIRESLEGTSTLKNEDGSIRHYHLLVSPGPDPELYFYQDQPKISLANFFQTIFFPLLLNIHLKLSLSLYFICAIFSPMGKTIRIINHQDAIKALLSYINVRNKELGKHPELLAIVTHWLQNYRSAPIFSDRVTGNGWLEFLTNYQIFQQINLKTPFQKVKSFSADKLEIAFVNEDGLMIPFPPPRNPKFTFIDLFAGIGGFRIALQKAGGKCVFSSDIDNPARETYFNNYGELPFGDIRQFTSPNNTDEDIEKLIPNHDVLAAGFPCQPFSRAGVSARNSLDKLHGFEDEVLGTLFYDIVRIAKVKRPKVLFLENVKNLVGHNNGDTYRTIKKIITKDLGYSFYDDVIDASRMVPQRRQRAYMVCFRDDEAEFEFPKKIYGGPKMILSSILEECPEDDYTISDKLWEGHQKRTKRNLERGTGFTAFLADPEKPANTLVARYYKDGKECLIEQKGKNPRMLTIREAARLQGFPEKFIPPIVKTRAYKQFGNSVAVPVVAEIAKAIAKYI